MSTGYHDVDRKRTTAHQPQRSGTSIPMASPPPSEPPVKRVKKSTNGKQQQERRTHEFFFTAGPDIITLVYSFLNLQDLLSISITCKTIRHGLQFHHVVMSACQLELVVPTTQMLSLETALIHTSLQQNDNTLLVKTTSGRVNTKTNWHRDEAAEMFFGTRYGHYENDDDEDETEPADLEEEVHVTTGESFWDMGTQEDKEPPQAYQRPRPRPRYDYESEDSNCCSDDDGDDDDDNVDDLEFLPNRPKKSGVDNHLYIRHVLYKLGRLRGNEPIDGVVRLPPQPGVDLFGNSDDESDRREHLPYDLFGADSSDSDEDW